MHTTEDYISKWFSLSMSGDIHISVNLMSNFNSQLTHISLKTFLGTEINLQQTNIYNL